MIIALRLSLLIIFLCTESAYANNAEIAYSNVKRFLLALSNSLSGDVPPLTKVFDEVESRGGVSIRKTSDRRSYYSATRNVVYIKERDVRRVNLLHIYPSGYEQYSENLEYISSVESFIHEFTHAYFDLLDESDDGDYESVLEASMNHYENGEWLHMNKRGEITNPCEVVWEASAIFVENVIGGYVRSATKMLNERAKLNIAIDQYNNQISLLPPISPIFPSLAILQMETINLHKSILQIAIENYNDSIDDIRREHDRRINDFRNGYQHRYSVGCLGLATGDFLEVITPMNNELIGFLDRRLLIDPVRNTFDNTTSLTRLITEVTFE